MVHSAPWNGSGCVGLFVQRSNHYRLHSLFGKLPRFSGAFLLQVLVTAMLFWAFKVSLLQCKGLRICAVRMHSFQLLSPDIEQKLFSSALLRAVLDFVLLRFGRWGWLEFHRFLRSVWWWRLFILWLAHRMLVGTGCVLVLALLSRCWCGSACAMGCKKPETTDCLNRRGANAW